MFFDNLLSFFLTNNSISRQPLAATLEIGGHIGIIWSLKQYLHNKFYFLHAQIYLLFKKNTMFWTVCCHLTAQWHYMIDDGGHLGYWRPYWKNLNIWRVFMTLFEHLLCLKHKIYCYIYLSQPSDARLRQKIGFQDSLWRPSWKMAAILKFCVARVFFLKGDPYRVFVPNLLLVS